MGALDTQHTHDLVAIGGKPNDNASSAQCQDPSVNLLAVARTNHKVLTCSTNEAVLWHAHHLSQTDQKTDTSMECPSRVMLTELDMSQSCSHHIPDRSLLGMNCIYGRLNACIYTRKGGTTTEQGLTQTER